MARLSDQNLMDKWAADVLPPRFVLYVLFVILVGLKVLSFTMTFPTADEAYYWLWAQHPALSYYDHPPLLAWVQSAMIFLFGQSIYAARVVTLITMAISAYLIWFWCRRLVPQRALDTFLAAIVFFMLAPMMMRYQSVSHQDCLLIMMSIGAAHFLALFVQSDRAENTNWWLYIAACVFIGLAGLSKYNGVFLAIGVALAAFVTPLGRRWLMHWPFWAGALLVLVMQSPVIIWNMQHDWPSFRYNLDDRIGQAVLGVDFISHFLYFILNTLFFLGPVFMVAVVRFAWPSKSQFLTDYRKIGRWIVIASTGTFVALCVSNEIVLYWNIVAFAVVAPVIIFFVRSRLEFYVHVIFCLSVGTWLMVNQGIYPLDIMRDAPARDIDISFCLEQIVDAVEAEEQRLEADFVLTTDYRTASLLSLQARRTDIQKIGARNDQFDFWFDQAAFKGKNAIVLADDFLPIDETVTGVFEKVTFLRVIQTRTYGFPMHRYKLYYAQNYSGAGSF